MIFDDSFNTDPTIQRADWEKLLRAELKLDNVETKTSKKTPEGERWPTLSLLTSASTQLPVLNSWKKAAQTYIQMPLDKISGWLKDDLASGVRLFFIEKEFVEQKALDLFFEKLDGFEKKAECEVFLLGSKTLNLKKTSFSVVDESDIHLGRQIQSLGGSNVQELALMACSLIKNLENNRGHEHLAVFVDSHFFRNIAKVRAAKLLALKIFEAAKVKKTFSTIGLTSYREWTLYERYSNMLRNDAAVASGYIAGCDDVQSSGYQSLFEIELTNHSDSEHQERSRRMARNTSHILALESMLGVVGDAAYGSYHLESLTQHYAQEAWKLMQTLLPMNQSQMTSFIENEAKKVRTVRTEEVRTRKHVLAGTNDFPDVKDHLGIKANPIPKFYRVAQDFEALRLKIEKLKTKPTVTIVLYGDYSSLVPRVNFVKNYFELLGLEVLDPGKSQTDLEAFKKDFIKVGSQIVVVCSSDENYEILKDNLPHSEKDKFIAGKFALDGYQNLFSGQNVYQVLESLTNKWGSK